MLRAASKLHQHPRLLTALVILSVLLVLAVGDVAAWGPFGNNGVGIISGP